MSQQITLAMSSALGSLVVSRPVVQAALQKTPHARVDSVAETRATGGAYRDFGATAIAIIGTPFAVAAVKELFGVIKVAIQEAHKTRRAQDKNRLELAKVLLTVGDKPTAINLDDELPQIEAAVAEVEAEAVRLAQ